MFTMFQSLTKLEKLARATLLGKGLLILILETLHVVRRQAVLSWKVSLFYYKTVFWPTEISMRNCLLDFNIKTKICLGRF